MDSEYLKKTVGEILSRGVAEVVANAPPDPVEYLARFLLHQEAQRTKAMQLDSERHELVQQKALFAQQLQAEKEEIARREAEAEAQRLREEEERRQAEQLAQRRLIAEQARFLLQLKEKEIEIDRTGKTADEIEAEEERVRSQELFKLARQQIQNALDHRSIDELKRYSKVKREVFRTVKAVHYIVFNRARAAVTSWDACRQLIGPSKKFIDAVLAYDPLEDKRQKKYGRVAKILQLVQLERVKRASFPAFLLYNWVTQAYDLRMKKLEEIQIAKQNEKEVEPLVDEEADAADEDAESDAGDAPPESQLGRDYRAYVASPQFEAEMRQLFTSADADGSNSLDFSEMTRLTVSCCQAQGWPAPSDDAMQLAFADLDIDQSGKVDFNEFMRATRLVLEGEAAAADMALSD